MADDGRRSRRTAQDVRHVDVCWVCGLRIGDGRKMSYHVMAGEEDGSVKAACICKMNHEGDGKAYIYWYKEAEDDAPDEWVRARSHSNRIASAS